MWEQINALLTQASSRIVSGFANFLPGLLVLVLIMLATFTVAALVRIGLRKFLRSIDFDDLVARWGFQELSEWSPKRQPALLMTRIVSWSIIVLGLLLGLSALDAALPSLLVVRVFSYIPNIIAAIFVLAVGTFVSRFLARIGGSIVTLSFAILFGGIVLALALAVGLGSKDMVSRSWEQQGRSEEGPEPVDHL
jgi:hypothetical protein